MNKTVNKKSIYFTLASLPFFIPPFFYMVYWIYCSSVISNREEAVAQFKSLLPEFMRSGGSTNFIFVIFAVLALILGAKGITNNNPFWHKLSMFITISGGLLAFLYLFQMM